MRHNKKFNHLGRTASHRKSMLANMACSLIKHKRIATTTAKAKALRVYIEPLLTKAKEDSTHSRRTVFTYLQNKEVVTELFRDVAQKIANRPGGYTRILKTGFRLGDAAEMCIIELVDYNENMLESKKATAKKSRTRRAGAKKSAAETVVTEKTAVKSEVKQAVSEETNVEAKTESPVPKTEEPVAEMSAPETEEAASQEKEE